MTSNQFIVLNIPPVSPRINSSREKQLIDDFQTTVEGISNFLASIRQISKYNLFEDVADTDLDQANMTNLIQEYGINCSTAKDITILSNTSRNFDEDCYLMFRKFKSHEILNENQNFEKEDGIDNLPKHDQLEILSKKIKQLENQVDSLQALNAKLQTEQNISTFAIADHDRPTMQNFVEKFSGISEHLITNKSFENNGTGHRIYQDNDKDDANENRSAIKNFDEALSEITRLKGDIDGLCDEKNELETEVEN